jgi:perosamine synthetase
MIPIYNPNIINYKTSAIKAVESGWISNHGEYVELATNKLKQILNSKFAILMANGTCATHCLFLALKYKYPNLKKIYVPNNCYVAAWNALLMEYEKNIIEVMKMDLNTWNINTDEEYILSLDSNAAVLIVHNLGNIINVPRLKLLRPDLIFIEDNCEGLFGKYDNIFSGSSVSTLCSSISFYGNKNITTGEGGAFITQDENVYKYIVKAYSQGLSDKRYLHDTHAYNYRMTNIQAAFLYDQLNDLDNILNTKQKVFENYNKLFKPLIKDNKIKIFQKEENTQNANWIYGIRIINNNLSIEETYEFLKKEGMDSRPFFYPINCHKHLKELVFNDNNSLILNKEIIMIPSSPSISYEEQNKVVNIITKFIFFLETTCKIIEINNSNKNILENFIKTISSPTFRYFNKRSVEIINNHLITLLIMDNDIPIGYAHIDSEDNKYWLGIYINDAYQNKGLGNKIIKYLINHYKIDNEIFLTVDNDNICAKKLYLKNGFKDIENNENYSLMKK